jgi:hypothetical protein
MTRKSQQAVFSVAKYVAVTGNPANPSCGYGFGKGLRMLTQTLPYYTLPKTCQGLQMRDNPYG